MLVRTPIYRKTEEINNEFWWFLLIARLPGNLLFGINCVPLGLVSFHQNSTKKFSNILFNVFEKVMNDRIYKINSVKFR